jgi:hypothetical protein
MSALRDIQQRIVAAVLQRSATAPDVAGILPGGQAARRRLGIYRVNARENFTAALISGFPVLHAELGDDEFRRLAWSYQLRLPSTSGNLFEAGRRLPAFLADALAGTGEAWLADLAQLEWAVQEAMVAPEGDARADFAALANVAPTAQAGVRLRLHPAVRVLQLHHPVLDRWRRHHATLAAAPRPDRWHGEPPERLLVRRGAAGIEIERLDTLDYLCLQSLSAGGTLGQLATAALEENTAPDLGAVLARWASTGIIDDIELPAAQAS